MLYNLSKLIIKLIIMKRNYKKKFIIQNLDDRLFEIKYKLPNVVLPKELKNISTKKKIKYINEQYLKKHHNLNDYENMKCNKCSLPDGMYVFKSIYDKFFLDKLFIELEKTFYENRKDKSFTYQEDNKRVFLFDNLNLIDIIYYSYNLNKVLSKYFIDIITDIMSNLHVPDDMIDDVLKKSKLSVGRYSNNKGISTHIDNIRRCDGIVITIPIGPDNTYYDLIPLNNKKKSIRLNIKEGEITIMDGLSRFIYAHSIPNNIDYTPKKIRYSLIFLISKFNSIDCKYDKKYYDEYICRQNDYSKYIENVKSIKKT